MTDLNQPPSEHVSSAASPESSPLTLTNGQRFGILGGAITLGLGLGQLFWPAATALFAGFGPNPATLALGMKGAVLGLVVIATMFVGHSRAQSAVALLATALSAAEVIALIVSSAFLAYLTIHIAILALMGIATALLVIGKGKSATR